MPRSSTPAPPLPASYVAMLSADRHDNVPAFQHYMTRMMDGVDIAGRRVLEIGSGRGLLSLYLALQGAQRVTSLEPEMIGATSGVIAVQRERVATLGLTNVEVVVADFNTWDAGDARFDVILSRASINHLYPSEHAADQHPETWAGYVAVARRIEGLLAPGGVFVATDACRHAFFTRVRDLGIRRPWRPNRTGIDWRHHQDPGTWQKLFRAAGFGDVTVDYPVPYPLRGLAPLVNTAFANYWLEGSFILRARTARR